MPKPAEDLFKKYAPDMSVASWGIRFAANLEDVMIVLSGMSNLKQLEDNVKYMENFSPLNKEEKKLIEEAVGIINSSIAIQCTACQYCVSGCPQNIAIPRYFALYNMEKQNPSTGFSLSKLYYSNYTKQYGKASDCIECGNCESSCPQHLNIINYLKDVKEMLE